jgi:hypothetical protein
MKKTILFMILVLPFLLSCKKLVEVATPQNQLTTDKVFSDTTAATAAMVNVYALFDKSIDPNYNKYMGVYTDELTSSSASSDNVQFSTGKLSGRSIILLFIPVTKSWKRCSPTQPYPLRRRAL